MIRERVSTAVILTLALLCLARCGAAAEDRAEWMYRARWGVFIHYLGKSSDVPAAEWNRLVDGFDVEGLADQLESAGAGYLVITIGQNSGHYLSPNRTYDACVGIHPSKCSSRDLVFDLSQALERKHIRLMVYLPAGAPDRDEVAMKKLEWTSGPDPNINFQRKWENVIGEWSARWGARIWGWWFDGCYWPNAMYRSCTPPNFKTFAAAARKGNPHSAVAFNPGVTFPIIAESEQEDYTAGEIDDPGRVRCAGRFVDEKQFHMLSYLGQRWSGGEPRFSEGQVVEWSTAILQHGGVVTWDVPTSLTGLIAQPFLRQLKAIGEAARRVNREP